MKKLIFTILKPQGYFFMSLFISIFPSLGMSQTLEHNSGRILISAQELDNDYELCGLQAGKKYQALYTPDNSNLLQSSFDFNATDACTYLDLSWSDSPGYLSISCLDCVHEANPSNFNSLTIQGSPNANAQDLIQTLLSPNCYQTSNYSTNGGLGIGTFMGGIPLFGQNEGIILSSGNVFSISGPSSAFASATINTGSDADLATISSPIFDASILEFDFITGNDGKIELSYAFASEEYCEWVNTGFNDVFAIFVSGPDIEGTVNIALTPDSLPVSINTIHPNQNEELFIPNSADCGDIGSAGLLTAFDGFTSVLSSSIDVNPNETYHIKIAIGDQTDAIYDSAVFLFPSTLQNVDYSVEVETFNNQNTIYETCQNTATLTFHKEVALAQAVTIPINLSPNSTATEGVDFADLPASIFIPPGAASASLMIEVYNDEIAEGIETIIFDGLGCPQNDISLDIAEVTPLFADPQIENECGSNTYYFSAEFGGGLPHYDAIWSVGNQQINADSLIITEDTQLTYMLRDGCDSMLIFSYDLIFSDGNTVSADLEFIPQCASGAVLLNANASGIGNLTYDWSFGSNEVSPVITITEDTNVSVSISDECNNELEQSIFIPFEEVEVLPLSIAVSQSFTCDNDNNILEATVFGGTPPYSYLWSNNGDEAQTSINVDVPTLVTLTITDQCNTETTTEFTATPAELIEIDYTIDNQCFASNDFPIEIPVTIAGTPPFIVFYSLNDGTPISLETETNTVTINAEQAGYYQITQVQQSNGNCADFTTSGVTISENTLSITGSTSIDPCIENSGEIDFNISGNDGEINLEWMPAVNAPSNPNNLPPGDYTLTATDANNCTTSATYNIENIYSPLEITETQVLAASQCENGSALVLFDSASENTSILWSNGETTAQASALPFGENTVTITNDNDCSVTATVNIEQAAAEVAITANCASFGMADAMVLLSFSTTNVPYAEVVISGENNGINLVLDDLDITYSENSADWTIENIPADIYTVQIIDGCDLELVETFAIIAQQVPPAELILAGICAGESTGSIGLEPNENWQIPTWTDLEQTTWTINNLSAGTYSYTIQDNNACPLDGSITLTEFESVELTGMVTPLSSSTSMDATISTSIISGTAPFEYLWNTGDTTPDLANLSSGEYTLTVTDVNGCQTTEVFLVQPFDCFVSLEITAVQNATCYGDADGSISISASGGMEPYTYLWSNNSDQATANNLPAGTYSVTVTDAAACPIWSEDIEITQPDSVQVSILPGDTTLCAGETITLIATGDYPSYNWSNNESGQEINVSEAGNYFVTALNENDCSDMAAVNIDYYASFSTEIDGTDLSLINTTESYSVQLTAGQSATWTLDSGGDITSENNLAEIEILWTEQGSHDLILNLTDENGCSSEPIVLTIFVALTISTDDISEQKEFSVYPNPFQNFLTIKTEDRGIDHLRLTDVLGRQIHNIAFPENGELRVSLRGIAPGVYFLQALDEARTIVGVKRVLRQ